MLNPFKITNILTLSECRSRIKRNLCEDVKNPAMGDAENDMKKDMVRIRKIFENINLLLLMPFVSFTPLRLL